MVEMKDVGFVVAGFITIFIALVLINPIADEVFESRDLLTQTNDEITLTGGTGTLTNTWAVSISNITNSTSDLTSVINQDIEVDQYGNVVGNATFAGLFNFTYTYGNDGYVQSANARALTPLITIFFALAIFSMGIWFVYKGLQGTGMF